MLSAILQLKCCAMCDPVTTKWYPRQLCSVRLTAIQQLWKWCREYPALGVRKWEFMGVQLEPMSLAFYSAPAVRRSGSHFLSLLNSFALCHRSVCSSWPTFTVLRILSGQALLAQINLFFRGFHWVTLIGLPEWRDLKTNHKHITLDFTSGQQ